MPHRPVLVMPFMRSMAASLVVCSRIVGPIRVLMSYVIPYWMQIFVMWLDMVTYLHHRCHEQKLRRYRGEEWSYLSGGLTKVDCDYGWINNIHHDIGTYVIHYLFHPDFTLSFGRNSEYPSTCPSYLLHF
ncbi:hypothetical protein C5167_044348 [Papaver somniferum]|uniref:Fatty acid desaturase domain-containing protein n=1 Tax=Papaver somniferum TaxID=3469 RepID=A0A4Y7LC38_PAPSO|nr:hypothetical protein C5167_044348 [Papaver somniferum]